jgi:aminodeoxyfutalosine synthase
VAPTSLDAAAQVISDPALLAIAERVGEGRRLTADEGSYLFRTPDLLGLGALADARNRALYGDRVTFAANQHINPTNVCVLRKTCVFCSYARLPKEEGAYRYTLDQVLEEAATANTTLTREFHIVGGLDMKAGLAYYADMFRALKETFPHVHIKALTAVEIAHIARIEKLSYADVLTALRESGLGIRSNCTMLYGHVETIEDRIAHLEMLRALQDETGGFLAYIPLAYHPDHNELGRTLGREGTATSGFDDLRNLAVGRLFLDNIPHVKTHWIMVTPFLSQTAMHFGVDDIEGTVVREKIYHEAGAHTAQAMTLDQILGLIRGAAKVPAERDSFYQIVRTFDDGGPTAAAA